VLEWRHLQEIVSLTCTARVRDHIISTNSYITSCRTAVVHEVCDTHFEARSTFVNWCLHVVHDGEIDPTLNLFSDEVMLVLQWICEFMAYSDGVLMLINMVPLCYCLCVVLYQCFKVFFFKTINSRKYVMHFLAPFVNTNLIASEPVPIFSCQHFWPCLFFTSC